MILLYQDINLILLELDSEEEAEEFASQLTNSTLLKDLNDKLTIVEINNDR